MTREVHLICAGDGCSEALIVTGNDAGLGSLDPASICCDPANNCAGRSS